MPLLTLSDIAKYLGVSLMTVYRLVKAGELKIIKIGRVIRVSSEQFDEFIKSHQS